MKNRFSKAIKALTNPDSIVVAPTNGETTNPESNEPGVIDKLKANSATRKLHHRAMKLAEQEQDEQMLQHGLTLVAAEEVAKAAEKAAQEAAAKAAAETVSGNQVQVVR